MMEYPCRSTREFFKYMEQLNKNQKIQKEHDAHDELQKLKCDGILRDAIAIDLIRTKSQKKICRESEERAILFSILPDDVVGIIVSFCDVVHCGHRDMIVPVTILYDDIYEKYISYYGKMISQHNDAVERYHPAHACRASITKMEAEVLSQWRGDSLDLTGWGDIPNISGPNAYI